MKVVLSGNEAIARGAWEAGCVVATAYPGTPSTEIVQAALQFPEINSEWCPNEKVALEVALGAAMGGGRALCAMKHVGLNVAADPLLTSSYTGIKGGLVIITADDPGMFSSQNEQDNRYYARLAKVPMLEPADSQEALEFVKLGFEISEKFDTPVLVRTTTRISHSVGVVEVGERTPPAQPGFERDPKKYVMIPGHARARHELVEERMSGLALYAEQTPVNRVEWGTKDLGVITGGVAYQYVREVLPECSVLKLGISHPLPEQVIMEFADQVDRVLVVEELDPIWEKEVRALGIVAEGKSLLPITGELSPDIVLGAARELCDLEVVPADKVMPVDGLPGRPPVLCPGCPHRGVFYVLRKLGLVVTGDIGCYTLGVQPPLAAIDTCTCMGAGIGQAMGMELAIGREAARETVAVIGDSTFVHSGITGLIEIVYNQGHTTVLILDNSTTAMTGHQEHPGTGRTASGEETVRLNLEAVCRAIGVEHVQIVDPLDSKAFTAAVQEAVAYAGPSVVITNRPCVLLDRKYVSEPYRVQADSCVACGLCLKVGCPAVEQSGEQVENRRVAVNRMQINPVLCTGCGYCAEVCPQDAIVRGGLDDEC